MRLPLFFMNRSEPKRIINASVREVVEFVLRTGGLGGSGLFAGPNRALEGTRAHIKHQKTKPAEYQSEVSVTREFDCGEFILRLRGRIDGLIATDGKLLVEEIKTVTNLSNDPADPLHWAQARFYARLYAEDHSFAAANIQLTYIELETFQMRELREYQTLEALKAFTDSVLAEFIEWLRDQHRWIKLRDDSIAAVAFPFREYRPGQRSLAVAVYRTIKSGGKLFAEAPTGIGKTISVLFPTIKAQGEGRVEKIFYTTAKTIGRTVAEKAIGDLRTAGLNLRSVTLTAKDKICFNDGKPCDLATCPFAVGYYDRIKGALKDAFASQSFTRDTIEATARKHQVCPFELSLDLSVWCDAIICDYNYVFDPSVSLKRFFGDEKREFAILVDEAHNLVDRAREMFSAELFRDEIAKVRSAIETDLPAAAKVLKKVQSLFASFKKLEGTAQREKNFTNKSCPPKLTKLLKDFCKEAEAWLAQNEQSSFHEVLLDFYFKALGFVRTAEVYDERYVTFCEPEPEHLKLFCIDPSKLIRERLNGVGSTVFFSATLSPIDYYRESLGGNMTDVAISLESPFPSENLLLMVQDRVATTLRSRAESYSSVAASIAALAQTKAGNYLAFFPSYEYMTRVLEEFHSAFPQFSTVTQKSGMTESERDGFLEFFGVSSERTVVGFAVLGGIFGEGIDLVGDRLIGVAVVGIGLPQICLERDLIREFWQNSGRSGFDYAYTFPGMNRVLQAVGRLIRTETDRGVVLLIDERFARRTQRALFPSWWNATAARSAVEIATQCEQFWELEAGATLAQDVEIGV